MTGFGAGVPSCGGPLLKDATGAVAGGGGRTGATAGEGDGAADEGNGNFNLKVVFGGPVVGSLIFGEFRRG